MPRTGAKSKPWFQNFQVIAYVVAGVTATGTAVTVAARYLSLPERVEAGEQVNQEQSKILDRLTYVVEQQQQLQQQQSQWVQPMIREYDADGTCWECREETREACWERKAWRPCP